MKNIAVICAMPDEAALLCDMLNLKKIKNLFSVNFPVYAGNYNEKNIIVTVCGVGKVYAAMTAAALIINHNPDTIINLGIAGGVAAGIKTGDICIAKDFVQYDYDLSPLGLKPGQIDDFEEIKIPADKKLSEELFEIAKESISDVGVYFGTVATGDRFVSSSELAQSIVSQYNAIVCEMEGGAIAQVCAANKISCTAIRSVSDNANEHAPYDFESFRAKAVENSSRIIYNYLSK